MVEEIKRVIWADLEDEELRSRYEQMAEKEEIMNRSETLTETQHDNDDKARQSGQQQQENTTQAVDDDDGKARQSNQQEHVDTRQAKDDDNDETRQSDQQQQEEDRGEHESEELIWTEEENDPNWCAYLHAPNLCPECQKLFDGCDCVDVDWTADSEWQRIEYEDGLKQIRDGEKRQEGERQKEMNDGDMRQENQQLQHTWRQENVGKDTLLRQYSYE